MREARTFRISTLVAIAAMAAPAHAQEAENPPAQQQRPPIFDLQPGPVREEPQPDVQGPRAPGVSAPRLIEDEEEPQVQAQPQPQPQPQSPASDVATASPSADQPIATADRAPAARSDDAPVATDSSDVVAIDAAPPTAADPSVLAPEAIAERDAPATSPAAPADTGGVPWWVWLGLVLAVGAAIAVVRIAASKRSEQAPRFAPARAPQSDRDPLPKPLPRPLSKPARPPAPQVAPQPLPTPPRAAPPAEPDAEDRPSRIVVDFQPIKARLSTVGLTISYRLDIQNVSDEDLTEIVVRLGIRCTDGQPGEPQINPEPPCVTLDRLKPGERHVQTSVIRLDPDAYRPVQSDGKPMIVPMVDMFPKYRDGDGDLHKMHAEMLIGREHLPPQPKMQPFWLERGFGQFEKIGCRMVSAKRL